MLFFILILAWSITGLIMWLVFPLEEKLWRIILSGPLIWVLFIIYKINNKQTGEKK